MFEERPGREDEPFQEESRSGERGSLLTRKTSLYGVNFFWEVARLHESITIAIERGIGGKERG